jgi:hypothetical protein
MRRVLLVAAALLIASATAENTVGDARGVQSKVDDLSHEMMQKMMQVEEEINKKKVPLYAERNEHLKNIEGFWGRTIQNHPSHGQWVREADRDMLRYISDISVEEIDPAHYKFKISMSLRRNPYVGDDTLWLSVNSHDANEHEASGVNWLGDNFPATPSFFSFFDQREPRMDPQAVSDLTHVLRYEFFQNPFTYHDIPTFDELAAQHHAGIHDLDAEVVPEADAEF